MRILQICHKPPFPQFDGGTIAMNNISQGLIQLGHEIKVIAITTPKHPVIENDEYADYIKKTNFESVYIDTSVTIWGALKSIFLNKSYHIERFDHKNFHHKLATLLNTEKFDIIQLETIYVAPYIKTIKQYSDAKIVIRLHNVEHQIWERLVENEVNIIKKIVLKKMASLLKKYELKVFKNVDAYMAISEIDHVFFKMLDLPIHGITIPFGIDIRQYQIDDDYLPSESPKLFHIGSMNWLPNLEGIEWFINEVWTHVINLYPDLTFTIAGRNMPDSIKAQERDGIIIAGEVPDARKFMLSKDIMIVPLLSGSGIRVKIIEGMALGKTIIATSIAAEGLDIVDGKNILIANTPEEMVKAIGLCVNSPEICKFIGENARNYVTLHHHNENISNEIIQFYNSLYDIKS